MPDKDSMFSRISEKIITTILVAIVSWAMGVFTNHLKTQKEIKTLKSDVENLEWGVDYYRK
jgi:cell division protein FtsL